MARIAAPLALALSLLALPAQARPYLMLDADDAGFKALDLGDIDQTAPGLAHVTMIEAPLKGAPVADKLAPLIERRVEVDCQAPRWRVLSLAYVDGQEREMGKDATPRPWAAFQDDIGPVVQQAACKRQYRQAAVSRYLNLGEILANFQAAHAKAAPEPPSDRERLEHGFRNGH